MTTGHARLVCIRSRPDTNGNKRVLYLYASDTPPVIRAMKQPVVGAGVRTIIDVEPPTFRRLVVELLSREDLNEEDARLLEGEAS